MCRDRPSRDRRIGSGRMIPREGGGPARAHAGSCTSDKGFQEGGVSRARSKARIISAAWRPCAFSSAAIMHAPRCGNRTDCPGSLPRSFRRAPFRIKAPSQFNQQSTSASCQLSSISAYRVTRWRKGASSMKASRIRVPLDEGPRGSGDPRGALAALLRQQNVIDDVDDAVRLHDVGDGDHGGPAVFVGELIFPFFIEATSLLPLTVLTVCLPPSSLIILSIAPLSAFALTT